LSRKIELIFLVAVDAVALAWANLLWYWARFEWGWFSEPVFAPDTGYVSLLVALLSLFWLVLFLFYGMYRERYASSRFDELVSLAKVVTFGILVLFFFLFIQNLDAYSARSNLLFYWAAVFLLVATGRVLVRSVQKILILRGRGLHRTLIVGWSELLDQLYEEVARYPEAGLDIVGAVRLKRERVQSAETLLPDGSSDVLDSYEEEAYSIEDLPRMIDDLEIQDVLIALGADDGGSLMEVLRLCDGKSVSLKLVPDFYTIIGGMARTEHMYGLPLIEVLPEPMQVWEQSLKRLFDMVVSGLALVVGLPIWIAIGLIIRLTSEGKAIYRQQRVGQHGSHFVMYKFRTMRSNAEAKTGPVWAKEDDPRYTGFGRWLRKWRIDEIPQMWNVFKGDMSLVGPRPERPYFVRQFAPEIPLYSRRQRVKPGITGWAQVKWKYDSSIDDVRQKVKYDLFYIENMSIRRDIQILFRTMYTAIRGDGH